MHLFAFFLAWRNLCTLPGRKSCMWSSSFPNTTSIPNFKPISLTVIEFWKRYHQTAKIQVLRPGLKVAPYLIVFICTMILVGLGGPPFTICTKYGFLVLFRRFYSVIPSHWNSSKKIRNNKLDTHFCSKPHKFSDVPIKPSKNPQLLYSTEQANWSLVILEMPKNR